MDRLVEEGERLGPEERRREELMIVRDLVRRAREPEDDAGVDDELRHAAALPRRRIFTRAMVERMAIRLRIAHSTRLASVSSDILLLAVVCFS
jgi:hypothetical protein